MNKTKFKSNFSPIQTLKRLWKYYSIAKWKVLLVVLCIIIGVAANISATYFMPKVLTRVFQEVSPAYMEQFASGPEVIWYGFALVVSLIIIFSVTTYTSNVLTIKISQDVGYFIRRDAFNKLQRLPFSYLDSKSNGDLTSRLTNDIDVTVTSLSQNSTQLIQAIVSVVGVFIAMMLLSSVITLMLIGLLILLFSIIIILVKMAQPHYRRQQELVGEINNLSEEYISGHKVVNIFGYEKEAIANFEKVSKELYKTSSKAESISRSIFPYNNFINNILIAFTTIICIVFILNNIRFYGITDIGLTEAKRITTAFETTFTFIILTRQFTTPISTIMTVSNQLQLSIVGASRAFELIDAKAEEDVNNGERFIIKNSDVEFKNVCFSYVKNDPNKMIIKNLSLKAKSGTTNAIVGPTGSGKTTIISLLNRFYDVDSGEILIDGKDISKYNKSSVRENITIVLQDSFLFSKSIKENIRYGRMDATDEEVINAAKMSNAWNFIQQLPNGIDTIIDEEKDQISEGQKQLISIARAFLSNAKIMILDEATSYVDTKTEKDIQDAMVKLMMGRTSFIIAHRLSTIKNSDNILVLKDGKLVEQGTHKQLMSKKGFYYKMSKSNTEE